MAVNVRHTLVVTAPDVTEYNAVLERLQAHNGDPPIENIEENFAQLEITATFANDSVILAIIL